MPKKTVVAIALSVVGLVLGSSIAVAMNLGILASTKAPDQQGELGVEVDPELTVATATPDATETLTTATAVQDASAVQDATSGPPSADEGAKVGVSYNEYDTEDDDYYDSHDDDAYDDDAYDAYEEDDR